MIVVLGALSVLVLLAVTLSRALRSERMVTRNFADDVRARQLVHVSLTRAMEAVDRTLAGYCYPIWETNGPALQSDVLCSAGADRYAGLLACEATNFLPQSLLGQALSAATNGCGWAPILSDGGRTNGRIAWMVVNCSGLLDANRVGGQPRVWSTNTAELSLYQLSDIASEEDFVNGRTNHLRYEDVAELAALNEGVQRPVRHFYTFSCDPGRDEYFVNPSDLGRRGIELRPKFDVNAITNYACYRAGSGPHDYWQDDAFMTNYMWKLAAVLVEAGFTNNAVEAAWNIVNYLDPDRIPQSSSDFPWLDPTVEAVPLINEVILQRMAGPPTNHYAFTVELAYPFCPPIVTPDDGFYLQVGVFAAPVTNVQPAQVMAYASARWSFTAPVDSMAFGAASTMWHTYASPTNRWICFPDESGTNYLPLAAERPVWFLARVWQVTDAATNIVDEALGYMDGCTDPADRMLLKFTEPAAWSANDPRLNGRVRYWTRAAATPGGANVNCNPMGGGGQGLLCYHRDAPMLNIGELGHIAAMDADAPEATDSAWRNVDLLSAGGGALLDRLTMRATNTPTAGLVSINASLPPVVDALFRDLDMGFSNDVVRYAAPLNDAALGPLVDAVIANGSYVSFADLFRRPALRGAFAAAVTNSVAPGLLPIAGDYLREAPVRGIAELVTFRQNVFAVLLAAQVTGRDGRTVLAERRALAVVCRDAYNGRAFVQSFRWLTD